MRVHTTGGTSGANQADNETKTITTTLISVYNPLDYSPFV